MTDTTESSSQPSEGDELAEVVAVAPEPTAEPEPTAAAEPTHEAPHVPKIGETAPAGVPLPPPAHPHGEPRTGAAGPGVSVGKVIDVEVTSVSEREVEVKLADGRTGVILRSDFGKDTPPGPGHHISAALLAREDPRKRVTLSRSWAVQLEAWERVEAAKASGEPVTGRVVKKVKGGFVVDLGVRAFLPSSMAGGSADDASRIVGTDVAVLVTEVDRDADRLVVSRRDLLRKERRQAERDVFGSISVGDKVTGRIVGVVEYGVHVDLGGARALLHRSELAWDRNAKPADAGEVGAEIEALVIEVNRSKRRIGLSLRQLQPDPLATVEVGSIHAAEVTRVVEYGVFARLEPSGIVGLVHMSELTDLPGYRPDEVVTPGERIQVKVLNVDPKRRRVGLSARQALWS